MAAEGRPEEGGPRRPVAPGSLEDTRRYRLRKPQSGFRPAPPAGPGTATDSLGAPRPVRLCSGRPAGPRQVSGPAAGRRRGKGRPPRRLTGASRRALGTLRDVSALPLRWWRDNHGESGDCESCPRKAPLRAAPPPSARASLAGRGRGAPVSGSRPSLTCCQRPPARPRRSAESARSVRAATGGAARGTGSNRRVWGGPRRCHVTARAANGRGRRRR